MSLFGWSYPAGCEGPPDDDHEDLVYLEERPHLTDDGEHRDPETGFLTGRYLDHVSMFIDGRDPNRNLHDYCKGHRDSKCLDPLSCHTHLLPAEPVHPSPEASGPTCSPPAHPGPITGDEITEALCSLCGASIPRRIGAGRPRVWCSTDCRELSKLIGRIDAYIEKIGPRMTGETRSNLRSQLWYSANLLNRFGPPTTAGYRRRKSGN